MYLSSAPFITEDSSFDIMCNFALFYNVQSCIFLSGSGSLRKCAWLHICGSGSAEHVLAALDSSSADDFSSRSSLDCSLARRSVFSTLQPLLLDRVLRPPGDRWSLSMPWLAFLLLAALDSLTSISVSSRRWALRLDATLGAVRRCYPFSC